ncbi:FtsX-like permease family protein [Pseudomonas sp. Fig-3]|uniref:ABC transporter permease n=1 Tax=Gammaproteobacteria TaxID=1236 RepID=UPI001112A3E6|nr:MULTISPECIES: ABC transporter permease [Gammaproteobacteria]KAB8007728.1 FtsX-like permease family protein [Klebsiella pneumoniae]KAB8016819.1 FtsX-like permease family protein [Klebsiella pneumoniae]KAB8029262.1 FtsX-like permease family protein [Klebsiella pneumoniae]MBB6667859.1 FtsX-like permease family protein [Klebsiella pneumoniae]TNB81437.1 FtsX-like permease family protein [Pseudomonas sp. Fig-3]
MIGTVVRGVRNPFRSGARAALLVGLLALLLGAFALLMQATEAMQGQVQQLQRTLGTVIELREAGAMGSGFGQGADEGALTATTLISLRQLPDGGAITRIEPYVYQPQIEAQYANVYAMAIGTAPEARLRALGDLATEEAPVVAGRGFTPQDAQARVAVVGSLYAEQRLGQSPAQALGTMLTLGAAPFEVVGVYGTGNDTADNHVFIPIETFRAVFDSGERLSKVFLTVESIDRLEAVARDLQTLPGVDVVTQRETVAATQGHLSTLAGSGRYVAGLLAVLGSVLVTFVLVLSMRARQRELATFKALGASHSELILQVVAEAATLCGLGAVGALLVAAVGAHFAESLFGLALSLDAAQLLPMFLFAAALALIGSVYPVVRILGLSPAVAFKEST